MKKEPWRDKMSQISRPVKPTASGTHADAREGKPPLRGYSADSAMAELSYALATTGCSVEGIANIVLNYARILTWSEHGYVSIIDETNGNNICLTLTVMIGDSCMMPNDQRGLVFPIQADGTYPGLWGHSLNTRTSFFTHTPADHESARGLPKTHIRVRNFLSVPVLLGDTLLGQICLANALDGYTDESLALIERVAVHYALAVAKQKEADFQREAQERRFLEEKLKLIRDQNRKMGVAQDGDTDQRLEELSEEIQTLKSLMRKQEAAKKQLEAGIRTNIETLIFPNLDKLKVGGLSPKQKMHLDHAYQTITEIFSPLATRAHRMNVHLTPQEIQVAFLVKSGKQTKEISELLEISANAVNFHRKNIRAKFGLNHKRVNLQSYLRSLEEL